MKKNATDNAKILTNTIKDSICNIEIKPIKFSDLWNAYPSSPPYIDPKTGEPPEGYKNQCAIKISVTLHKSGVLMKSYTSEDKIRINGLNTAVLAENLASWLKKMPFCGLPQRVDDVTGENWQDKIRGKTGIIFFKDYWARSSNEKTPTGDHIDLWNKDRLTPGSASFWRFTIGINSLRLFDLSDLGKSKLILFWEIN